MAAGGALCVYGHHAVLQRAGLWASFPTQAVCHGNQQVSGCLLTLPLTSTAISTGLGCWDELLATHLGTVVRGPS